MLFVLSFRRFAAVIAAVIAFGLVTAGSSAQAAENDTHQPLKSGTIDARSPTPGFAGEPNPVSPYIVGGVPAVQGQFPFMARLSTGCGGSLITPTYVLTAAHCVPATGPTAAISVTLGTVDLQAPDRITVRSAYVKRAGGWDGNVTHGDDWALIRLETPVNNVETLRLTPNAALDNGTFTIAGWGSTVEGANQEQFLRVATVPMVTDNVCAQNYPGRIVANEQICAGMPNGGVDTCQGDSGGPLFRRDAAGRWVQVGITSWGEGCARPQRPGVYTQLSTYRVSILAFIAGF